MNTQTVTLSKTKYEDLKREAAAYRKVAAGFFNAIICDPVDEVVEDFKRAGAYTQDFISDLEDGLRKSSYANRHRNKAASDRS